MKKIPFHILYTCRFLSLWKITLNGILLILAFSLQSQEYYFNNFSGKDGLAQSQAYALLEDQRGYIWVGTWGGGVSRYDGVEFVNYTQSDGVGSNYVYSLCEDDFNNIWIGTDKGVTRFNGKSYDYFLEQGRVQVYCLTKGKNGRLWIGTNRGLYFYENEKVQAYANEFPALKRLEVRSCYQDRHGFLWIGSSRGVFVVSPSGNIKHFDEEKGWNGFTPFSILEDDAGTVWVGTEGGGIQWSDGTQLWIALEESNGLSNNRVVHLHKSRNGEIWAGTTTSGINIWNPLDSTIIYLQERDGLESNDIRYIIEDSWGNHWVGTSGGGISKYSGQQFVLYDEADGLVDKEIYAVCEDTLGQIWMSTSRGISRFDGRNFQHFGAAVNWLNAKSRTVFFDKEGQLWAGFDNVGVGLYSKDTFQLFSAEEGIGAGLIRDIVQDSLGHIWVASTKGGVTRLVPDIRDSVRTYSVAEQYNRVSGFPANYIYALLIDLEGRMWFASRYLGLGYLNERGEAIFFDQRDGLPDAEVRSLTMDSLGNCWAGTARGGIFNFRWSADTLVVQSFDTKDQLTSNNIYQLTFDGENHLWVGHEKGVDRVFLDKSLAISEVKAFGYAEGFKGGETCNGAAILSSKGELWFGTMNGLMRHQPGESRKNTIAPKLHIEQVRLFYQPLQNTKYKDWSDSWGGLVNGLQLPYRQNSLGFFFKGINHSNPGKVKYQWQLEGYEDEWSPLSANNSVNYSNLPPQKYVFKVRAYNEDGVTNAEPVTATFRIDAPFWQRWWFRLVSIALVLLTIGMVFRTRLNQLTRKAKEEKAILEMEKNLLQLEQKALQLQMNPHFIFNALNSIQYLINEKDHKKARYQLAKFSKLMRSTLENSRTSVLPLSEEIKSLDNYLTLEQFSRNNTFQYKIEVQAGLDTETLYIPPMMIQPFVENAIIHGVAHLSDRKGEIILNFTTSDELLLCTVQDNGIGRAQAKKIKSQQSEQHKSAALQVTRERLALLENGVEESLIIEDVFSDMGEIEGTKVLLKIPLMEKE